ncbi:MAG: DUF2442 domain-containing protein [Armatimonadetes bacterium]|nr:DUF2442 domain-containing protein [Armatimonadota bacterium]
MSRVEVSHVSPHGIWVLADDHEHFLPYADFPWFRQATVGELFHVIEPSPGHLYWPDLDVDLTIASIEHPEDYPLVSRV